MERHLAWEGTFNVRDLGGLGRVRRGALVRGDSSGGLSAAGWAALEAHGVRTVVDLRNDDECSADLARPASVGYVRLPLDGMDDRGFWDVWQNGPQFGTPLYYQPHLEHFPERSAAVLRAIANAPPGGVFFHCARGRDRTGQIAMLVLAVLGVSADEIAADYVESYARVTTMQSARGEPDEGKALRAHMTTQGTDAPTVLRRILATLDVEATLKRGGATDADFTTLRTRALG
ncbi:MAG: tyrosine-protein phosphatase [Labilithrix sp.]|nr:tyrosine-protein phosphatase [Labilithrix sp.]MCW5812795.1 tyrosine-protein phosphatase [Labilithrix sp.]